MSKSQSPKPIEIKISTIVAISAILHESDLSVLDSALKNMTGGMPDFFDDEFAVVDIGSLDTRAHQIDWPALIGLLKSYRLNPVAVRNAAPELESGIVAHGLSLDAFVKPREVVTQEVPAAPRAVIEPLNAAASMIVDTPVRAGQRIYARNCDLVVTAAVNNGAEIIADGSIHIYAPLRGRALAGASGNPDARIFTMSLEAELVSIAGVYRTFEDGFSPAITGHPTQIRLAGDRIEIHVLNSGSRI